MPPHGPSRSRSIPVPEPTTKPLEAPRKGLLVFEANTRSMATVTKVDDQGFDVWVHNGQYEGRAENGEFRIFWNSMTGSGVDHRPGRFEEVVSLTTDEVHHWYLDSVPGIAALMKAAGPAADSGRLEQLIQERGDDDAIADRAIEFLKAEGLAGRFADFLAEHPAPARDEGHEAPEFG